MCDRTRLPSASGQSATEYMLMISVLVVAVVAGAYTFVPSFRSGTGALASDASSILDGGSIGGVGLNRNGVNAANSFVPGQPETGVASDNPLANGFGNGAPMDLERDGNGLGQPVGVESSGPLIGGPANAANPANTENKKPTF